MRILVTGGAGFVGAALCAALLDRSCVSHVRVLDDLSTGDPDGLDGAELRTASVLDRDAVAAATEGMDAVVHLAARPASPETDVTGTLNVLDACREHAARVILASSASVYGSAPGLPKREELPARPLTTDAAGKVAAEAYTLAYAASFGLPVLPLRLFSLYGPGQRPGRGAAVIASFVDAALRGAPLRVYGNGRQTRDFTYVGSAAEVLAEAVLRKVTSPAPVNLGFGTRVPVLEVAHLVGDLVGRRPEIVYLPPRTGDVRDSQAAPGSLAELFPEVKPVDLLDGLVRTIAWQRALSSCAR
ncbi:NAD-dependent epimerase/dehydratase family protein [Nonomuraea sp. NBC_01738]|uniref:NAD-dependent epimerase/dehydratase family protein n=1 Tax=Nonomuraea sp. NBC_01738 TaxID=2976003 RepID=UPI002E0E1B4F|nr:NAD-dependent epimerase/dehydratase family protein [Nonomuraea sp. NBC_01738]